MVSQKYIGNNTATPDDFAEVVKVTDNTEL